MTKIIPSLNGLRAICIFMVVCNHFQENQFFFNNKALKYVGLLAFNGSLAVNIFFILSGFLITKLLIDEHHSTGKISLKQFYLRRILRIFPAYYFLLFIYSLLQLYSYINLDKASWLSAVTFTRQFIPGSEEIDHFWSLSVEELFYLAWPVLFITCRNKITAISFVLIAGVIITRFLASDFPVPRLEKTIFTTGDALLIGCLMAIWYQEIVPWVTRNHRLIYLASAVLVISIILYNYPFHLLSQSTGNRSVNYFLLRVAYSLFGDTGLITNLAISFIVVFSIQLRSIWFWFLNTPILNHIGKLSYSIYLWQALFTVDRTFFHGLPLFVLVIFIYSTAYFSYRFIEKPFLGLKRKLNQEPVLSNASRHRAGENPGRTRLNLDNGDRETPV